MKLAAATPTATPPPSAETFSRIFFSSAGFSLQMISAAIAPSTLVSFQSSRRTESVAEQALNELLLSDSIDATLSYFQVAR